MLIVQANHEYLLGRDYTSARLTTQFKGDWTYGRYEIRAKLPTTQGIWPAFWLLPSRTRYGSGAAGGEIDIMELVGRVPPMEHCTLVILLSILRENSTCLLEKHTRMISMFLQWSGNRKRSAGMWMMCFLILKRSGLLLQPMQSTRLHMIRTFT